MGRPQAQGAAVAHKTETEPKVVVITGATGGVGRATARAFAAKGASIALLARGEEGLDSTRRELKAEGARVLAIQTDVADADAVERAARKTERKLGPIDVWVNTAMTSVFAPVVEIEPEEFRRVTEVTYLGTVFGTLAAVRRMLPRDSGVIVQAGCGLVDRGIALQSAYCGAKHAIEGFTDSLRAELEHQQSGVRVTMLALPPLDQPELAADAIVAAAEHPAGRAAPPARRERLGAQLLASRRRRALAVAGVAGALAAGAVAATGRHLRR